MILNDVAGIDPGVLPAAELRDHLRMGTGFDDDAADDAVLEQYLRAAVAAIEARTGKALFSRNFTWVITRWQSCDRQALPVAPVASVDGVSLLAANGVETVLDMAQFALERDEHRPILKATDGALPVIASTSEAELRFTAGYGAAWNDIPADLRQATLVLAATYFEYRQGERQGGDVIPFGVMALLEPYRAIRVSGGVR